MTHSPATEALDYLLRQHETAWKLAAYHLNGLTTAECLWQPALVGLHVRQTADGRWQADWPEREAYDIGPPSIAWLTWHLGFWQEMAIDHAFGDGRLQRIDIFWPGDASSVRDWLTNLQSQWRMVVGQLSANDLHQSERTRWPFKGRPFGDVVAWANVELTKNAAEIGYARFLYATRGSAKSSLP
jgi:hypothetical protein